LSELPPEATSFTWTDCITALGLGIDLGVPQPAESMPSGMAVTPDGPMLIVAESRWHGHYRRKGSCLPERGVTSARMLGA